MVKFILIFGAIVSVMSVFGLYALKVAIQYQYLRLKKGLKRTDLFEAWSMSLSKEDDKKRRSEAVMLFPMFFPIELDEQKEELLSIKKTIKKIHILIYFSIMAIMLIGVYASKAFPNGIFQS